MLEIILFTLLGLVAILFFLNHLVFKGKLFKKENTGYLLDFVKYGTIALVLIIIGKYVFGN